jgi:hypothetical protein
LTPQARPRLQLLLIAALFLLPFLAALLLRFGGWQPGETRNHGELLQPPLSMAAVAARVDGVDGVESWVFENVDRQWSLLARLPAACAAPCRERLDLLTRVRHAQGRHAEKLHLFALDPAEPPLPAPIRRLQLDGELPAPLQGRPDGELPELWLVDPHGFLVMHYPPGFDPSGLRRDLSRLVR